MLHRLSVISATSCSLIYTQSCLKLLPNIYDLQFYVPWIYYTNLYFNSSCLNVATINYSYTICRGRSTGRWTRRSLTVRILKFTLNRIRMKMITYLWWSISKCSLFVEYKLLCIEGFLHVFYIICLWLLLFCSTFDIICFFFCIF